jgi:hypothetical protein
MTNLRFASLEPPELTNSAARLSLMPSSSQPPTKEAIGTDDEFSPLCARQQACWPTGGNLLDAVPQRFSRALDEASRLLEPNGPACHACRGRRSSTHAELDQWLAASARRWKKKLKDGPVIL